MTASATRRRLLDKCAPEFFVARQCRRQRTRGFNSKLRPRHAWIDLAGRDLDVESRPRKRSKVVKGAKVGRQIRPRERICQIWARCDAHQALRGSLPERQVAAQHRDKITVLQFRFGLDQQLAGSNDRLNRLASRRLAPARLRIRDRFDRVLQYECPHRDRQPSLHRVRCIESRAPTDNTIRLTPRSSDQSTGGYPDVGRRRAYAICAQRTKALPAAVTAFVRDSVEPRTRLLGHTDP